MITMVKAALISQGSTSSKWTLEAMKKYFNEVEDIKLADIDINISGKTAEILYKGKPFPKFDCVYAKGSFRYAQVLRALTNILEGKCYMPINSGAFIIAHDKLLTQLMLQQHSIPMPKTYISSTVEAARELLSNLNYPIIMKFPQGTQGKGVMFADTYGSASSILDALSALKQPFVIQEFIETDNTDVRAFVIGEKVVASMIRKGNPEEKRANIHQGGVGENIELDDQTKSICIKAAKATGAEICGVDILISARGPLVIETNISPGLQGISKYTKTDVAVLIAKFLFDKTLEWIKLRDETNKKDIVQDLAKQDHIIANIDLRGSRILLPEIITKSSKLTGDDQVEITVKKGEIKISKIDIR